MYNVNLKDLNQVNTNNFIKNTDSVFLFQHVKAMRGFDDSLKYLLQ